MKLSTEKRQSLFDLARMINPLLGALFQNEMEITPEFVDMEINEARHQKGVLEGYIKHLEELKKKVS